MRITKINNQYNVNITNLNNVNLIRGSNYLLQNDYYKPNLNNINFGQKINILRLLPQKIGEKIEVKNYFQKQNVHKKAIKYFFQLCDKKKISYADGQNLYKEILIKFQKDKIAKKVNIKDFKLFFSCPDASDYRQIWNTFLTISNSDKIKNIWDKIDILDIKKFIDSEHYIFDFETKIAFLKKHNKFFEKEFLNEGAFLKYFKLYDFSAQKTESVMDILTSSKYKHLEKYVDKKSFNFNNLVSLKCDASILINKISDLITSNNSLIKKNNLSRVKNIKIIPNNLDKDLTDIILTYKNSYLASISKGFSDNTDDLFSKIITLNQDGNIMYIQKTIPQKKYSDELTGLKTITFFPTHKKLIKTNEVKNAERFMLERENIKTKDTLTGKIESEIISPSQVTGALNVSKIKANGAKIPLVIATNKNNVIRIKKNLKSFDGTKTLFNFSEDTKTGNRKFEYKIVAKDGSVLLDINESIIYLKDKIISTRNGITYEITEKFGKMFIKNCQTNEIHKINIIKLTGSRLDEETINVLRRLSFEELITIHKKINKFYSSKTPMESLYNPNNNIIEASGIAAFEHELGHAKSHLYNKLSSNYYLQEIYKQEKKLFIENLGKIQQRYIDYFLNPALFKDKYEFELTRKLQPLEEIIAETNTIIHYPNTNQEISNRFHYLQQYFPRTIAYVAKFLSK